MMAIRNVAYWRVELPDLEEMGKKGAYPSKLTGESASGGRD